MTAHFCPLLVMAALFGGVSASANITTVATDSDMIKSGSESPSTRPDLNSTTDALNVSTSTSSIGSSETPTLPIVQTDASPPTILPPACSTVCNVVVLIFFFCFLILLFFFAFKWYVRKGRPSPAEIGRSLVECVSNVWAAAADLRRPSSKDIEEEHEDEEEMAGIKTAEDQNNRGGDAEDDSDEDSSDYSNMGGAEWTKKAEDIDGQGNEGEDEMSSVELKDETERIKDNLTVL